MANCKPAQSAVSDALKSKRFDALLLASASIVWWTNAAGEFDEVQPYWEAYTGQTWEEYRGSGWTSRVHPDDRDRIIADWAKAVASGGPYFTQGRVWSARHGAFRAFQTRGIAIRNERDEIVEWLGAQTDVQDTIDVRLFLRDARKDLADTLQALCISEEKSRSRAERLRALSNELSIMLNTAGIGITRCSRDLRYVRANETYATIAGLRLPQIIGRPIVEVIGEAAFTVIRPYIERVLAGECVEYESEIPFCNAAKRSFFRVVYVPDCDPDGCVIGWIACVADITSSKRAERRIAERNAQLDFAGKISGIGLFTYDHATRKLQFSPGLAVIYGLPEESVEISRENWRARVHPDDLPRLDAIGYRALANKETELVLEFRILRDGEVRWIESRVLISYNEVGRAVRRIGAQVDVTERKRAEDALAERNAQLALAGRAAQVGVYTYDVNKGAMLISEGYAAIHGLPGGTTETSYSEWRARVHPEDLDRAEAPRDQAFADRQKEDKAEYRIVLPTGEVRWIERRGSISYGEDGRPEREIGANIDVTERKRAEQYQLTLNSYRDHRVKNVLATVRAMIAHTREASGSSEDFVARLDHRIEALARTHELLSESKWRSVPLVEIIRRELAPYNVRNTDIGGPDLTLKAGAAEAVAMVLHELTTNAAKYGALSSRTGRVSVRWHLLRNGSPDGLAIEWQEIDGPPVPAPSRSSYGSSIIRDLIPFELGGAVELSFPPGGTRCRLEIPGEWASRTAEVARVSRPTN